MTAAPIKVLRESIAALNAEETKLRKESSALYATATAESNRALTAEEKAKDDARFTRIEAIQAERTEAQRRLSNEEALAEAERRAPALGRAVTDVREGWQDDPKRGFASPKALLLEVMSAGRSGRVDPRLASLRSGAPMAAAGADEHSTQNDPYGGYLIPTALMPGLKTMPVEVDPFSSRTTKVDMTGARVLKINARVDKDHASSVSGGLSVYRRVETQTVTASRTKFEQVTLEKNELMGVTYASEELLAASPLAFASLLSAFFSDEFAAKVLEERLNGDGVGRYHGFANSPALVTVSKETAQAADTIVFANIVKMIARCWGYGNAIWFANQTCYPQLRQMTQPGSTIPIFATGQPGIASLEGRPIFFSERAAALGDLGDLILINPSEYLESDSEAIQGVSSIHVRFLEHEQTFKFFTANAGAGWWRTQLTPKRGSSLSPFVYLEAR